MILVVSGTRTFGELEYDKYRARKLKYGTGKLDPMAVMCVTSYLDGLWSWAAMGYMVTDLYGFKLVGGDCPTGLDRIVRDWADDSPTHTYEKFPVDNDPAKYPDMPPFHYERKEADWDTLYKAAGPIRNGEMLDYAKSIVQPNEEILVAGFFDIPEDQSKGTSNCLKQAKQRKLPIIRIKYDECV